MGPLLILMCDFNGDFNSVAGSLIIFSCFLSFPYWKYGTMAKIDYGTKIFFNRAMDNFLPHRYGATHFLE